MMADPNAVAEKAAKVAAKLGFGSGELLSRASRVETTQQCAEVLADCIARLPMDGPADPDALEPKDAARVLSVSEDTVLGWIRDRELRAANIASRASARPRWIVTRSDLDAFLKNRQSDAPAARRSRQTNVNGFKRY